ncbi:MAG: NTP transferase domain-containing protein [bacterium]
MISAIILAAGASTRMGKPKALVKFKEKTFLETVIDNFQKAGIEKIIVVLGHAVEEIATKLKLPSDLYVLNEKYTLGQFSSFQTGVKYLEPDIAGTFLALVDQPQIGETVLTKLLNAFVGNSNKIIIPTYQGKRGHPPIFPKTLFHEILSSSSSQTAADLIRKNQDKVLEVKVKHECILWNINNKQDLHEVRKRSGF